MDLDSVIVSAQFAPTVQSELLRVVHVIRAEEIQLAPVSDLGALLEYVRGVDIRQRGITGAQSDISMRGGTFDQVLVLLNGINISDPQTGHHNMDIPVDITAIERIEVLQGSGARIFGPNAFAGAINIITSSPEKAVPSLSLRGGLYGTAELATNLPFRTKKVYHVLSLSGNTTDGYTDNTDFMKANAFYRMNAKIGKIKTDVQAGYILKEFGANSFYTPKFPNQFEATSTIFASAGLSDLNNQSWKTSVYWRRHYDRFELFRNDPPAWYKNHNYHLSDVAGASVEKTFSWKKHKTSLGADFRMEHIFSNVLGTTMNSPIAVAGTDSAFYTKSAQRNGFSIMAEHSYTAKKFSVSGGALLYLSHQLENDISVYPGIDLGYQIIKPLRIFATANRSLRLPNFTNLYYSSPTNIGNPLLKPEEAISIEGGLKWDHKNILAEVAGFQRYGINMIDWVRHDTATVWECKNLTAVNVSGIEAGISVLPDFFRKKFFIQRFSVNYTFLVSDKSSEGFVSQYVLDYMKHKLDIRAVHRITDNAGLTWQLGWQDRAGGYTPFSEGVYLAEAPYKPVWLADAGVFYQWKQLRFTVNATNLFNTKIIDHANVSQPGFMLMGGISWKYERRKTK
ncbi:MAG: hypothetical protein A2W93_10995 [Bacteroidetes bacterium GWF2_43_63]|nr:MAG: hypothetical protein A2W94_13865 [Bacteroidetes bacterium GWE2_42_42]OFY54947.1 MAG: hypothetical protein A2W93_10995 [Bacteroidetes bacterium GWF2_43_63]